MIVKRFFWISLICVALIYSGCSTIFEKTLSGSLVSLEAPGKNYQTANYTQNFYWDLVDGALNYHLQIVNPTFDSIGSLLLDTLVKKNTFPFTLSPGKYQWHVQGVNGSSQTPYSSPRNLIITIGSLSQQTLQLVSPLNNSNSLSNMINFQWNTLFSASRYRLEVDTNNFANESLVVLNQLNSNTSYSFILPKIQNYQWRVRGESDSAQSRWSAVNTFSYSLPLPAQVILTSPADRLPVSLPVALSWNSVSGANSYKLYAYKSDSVTTYNSIFPLALTLPSYSFNFGTSGERIIWKVSALNAAGKEGIASLGRSFVIQ